MVCFVVDDDDWLLAGKIAAHTPDNLIRRLREWIRLALSEDGLGEPGRVASFPWQEAVIVRDRDTSLSEPCEQI